MPYLPTPPYNDTHFPTGSDVDRLTTAVGMIREKWSRFYPLVAYEQIKFQQTVAPAEGFLAGITGETIIDNLYGEAVPRNNVDQEWIQPHDQTITPPLAGNDDTVIYHDPIDVYMFVDADNEDLVLNKTGLTLKRVLNVTFATPNLDDAGVTVQVGDRFTWNNTKWIINGWKRSEKFWKYTDTYLYVRAQCDRWKVGS